MAKSLSTIQTELCSSGIGRLTNPVGLLQSIGQLYDDIAISTHGDEVTDWLARVAAAGGATPSDSTVNALEDFIAEIAAFKSKMVNLNPIVPDNLIAAGTPLIKTYGTDTWTNFNFVSGDLTVDGIIGNGTTKYFKTGVIPSAAFAIGSFGVTVYAKANTAGGVEVAGYNDPANQSMQFYANFGGTTYFDCWGTVGGGRISAVPTAFSAYLSGNRISTTNTKIYNANSVTPHVQIATGAGSGGSVPTVELYTWAANNLGTAGLFSAKRLSFVAVHAGLTSAESASFYAAIQNLRVLLGGGFT